ncbi:dipeptidase [Sphingomonas sp. MMS24-J13]|uniref:dipeptidase n=1 Tax=Sphingomonas sp. MMS24-J13 TaxID=3238686 RepID=UPI00384C55A0
MTVARSVRLIAATLMALAAPAAHAQATAAETIHDRILPFDPHLDLDTNFDVPGAPATADGPTQFDLAKTKRGGIKAVGLAVFVPQEDESPAFLAKARGIAEAKHRIIFGLAAHYPGQAERALTPDDVRRIAAAGKLAIVETVVNGGAFVDSLDDIDRWQQAGVRIFGLVHAGHNRLADSSRPAITRGEGPSRNGGLSSLGRQVVERLNRLGVLIDVSQLSDAAFDDVLRLTRAPVIASHSDVRALVDNGRNLTDAQLDAIKANGGVVAINAFSAYLHPQDPAVTAKVKALQAQYGIVDGKGARLTPEQLTAYNQAFHDLLGEQPKASLAELADAIDYAVKRIGIDHVAISSDFNHGGGVIGWANEGEAGNVTAELVRRGYNEADIAKLWSGNVLRVWAQAIAVAQRK